MPSARRGARRIPDAAFLYVSTIVMAAGVSIMQPSLPPLVRAWFPQRIGFATAVYTTGLLIGEILAAALTIPLILPLVDNSWRLNFVVWSVPVLATALLVAICAPQLGGAGNVAPVGGRRWWPDWRRPLIWRLGLILGSVNATYFVTNAFLPDYMIADGPSRSHRRRAHRAQCRPAAGGFSDAGICRAAGEAAVGLCGDRRGVAPASSA